MLSLNPLPFVQSFFDMHAPRQPHAVNLTNVCVFLSFCFFGDVAFSEYFCTIIYIAVFSLDQPGKVANPARGQLNRENEYSTVRVRA